MKNRARIIKYYLIIVMNFFKKVLGFGGDDLNKTAQGVKIQGTFYRVIKDARSIM